MLIGLVELLQVGRVRNDGVGVLGLPGPLAQSLQQQVRGSLQIDDQVRRAEIAREQFEQPLVDEQLVVVQVQVRVDLVAIEEIVGDGELAEEVRLPEDPLLAVTRQQVEELRLQRGARTLGIEVGEKRVLTFLQHQRGVETAG